MSAPSVGLAIGDGDEGWAGGLVAAEDVNGGDEAAAGVVNDGDGSLVVDARVVRVRGGGVGDAAGGTGRPDCGCGGGSPSIGNDVE